MFSLTVPNPVDCDCREIVIRVGPLELTNYGYGFLKKKEKRRLKLIDREFDEATFVDLLIDKMLVISEAKSIGYDSNEEVSVSFDIVRNYVLTSDIRGPYGCYLVDASKCNLNEELSDAFEDDSKKLLSESRVNVDFENCSLLVNFLFQDYRMNYSLLPECDEAFYDKFVCSFFLCEELNSMTVRDFLDEYNKSVFRRELNSVDNIVFEIKSIIVRLNRKMIVERLGLDNEWSFLEESKLIRNNIVYNIFVRDLRCDDENFIMNEYLNKLKIKYSVQTCL